MHISFKRFRTPKKRKMKNAISKPNLLKNCFEGSKSCHFSPKIVLLFLESRSIGLGLCWSDQDQFSQNTKSADNTIILLYFDYTELKFREYFSHLTVYLIIDKSLVCFHFPIRSKYFIHNIIIDTMIKKKLILRNLG